MTRLFCYTLCAKFLWFRGIINDSLIIIIIIIIIIIVIIIITIIII